MSAIYSKLLHLAAFTGLFSATLFSAAKKMQKLTHGAFIYSFTRTSMNVTKELCSPKKELAGKEMLKIEGFK